MAFSIIIHKYERSVMYVSFVCMYVCMYVCVYVRKHSCICVLDTGYCYGVVSYKEFHATVTILFISTLFPI
jgi:hypothetical protein